LDSAYAPELGPGAAGAAKARGGLRVDRYLVANVTLWLVTYLLITVRSLGMGTSMPRLVGMGVRRAAICLSAIVVCVLIQRALMASRPWPRGRRIVLAIALSAAGGLFYTLTNQFVFYVAFPVGGDEAAHTFGDLVIGLAANFSVLWWSFIAWCAIVFALSYDEEARVQTLRLVEAQALAAESQNQMLRYQINPHFLFNTLNALSSLILQGDNARAERMVLSLSNFLRVSLENAPGDRITLAEELEAQRQYLAIEQERFGDRLKFRERVPAELEDALVPGLILQPLIENAVKYGVARTRRPVAVDIAATAEGGLLKVVVRDDAVPDPGEAAKPQALGVGLANVRRRLQVLYGEAGRLTAGVRPDRGFEAVVELPLERR
jgi:two-component sensor histidine kinase